MRVHDVIPQDLPMREGKLKVGNSDSDFNTGSLKIIPKKNADP